MFINNDSDIHEIDTAEQTEKPVCFTLSGRKGSGKDTLYRMFIGIEPLCFKLKGLDRYPSFDVPRYAFADRIKIAVQRSSEESDEEYRSRIIAYAKEQRRIDKNVFSRGVERMFQTGKSFVVTDMRLVNEWDHINNYATMYNFDVRHVRVVGDGYDGSCTDLTETEHLDIPFSATAERYDSAVVSDT